MASDELTIEAIFVADPPYGAVRTESYLNSLSETEWTDLRAEATRSRHSGTPLLRCGDCRSPVYARESNAGRRHCYHFGTDLKDCRWPTANARDFRSIDAEKFGGNQEGEHHKTLKAMICEILALDPAAAETGITAERYTRGADRHYAFPDVFATSWQGGPAAFEIQLATTQLPTIIRREEFYKANAIRLCWIIGHEEGRLGHRTLKDIYLRNDGQILGVDGEVLAAARQAGTPLFRLYRLLPGPVSSQFAPLWKNRLVRSEEIDWGAPGDRPRSALGGYDAYFNSLVERDEDLRGARERFYAALGECAEAAAGSVWDAVAHRVGGRSWKEVGTPYDTVRALGVLATVRRGEITVATKIDIGNLPHLINSILLEPPDRRCWTHAFKLIAQTVSPDILTISSIMKKCARNFAEQVSDVPVDLTAGQVFNVFFPEGAFQRLQQVSILEAK